MVSKPKCCKKCKKVVQPNEASTYGSYCEDCAAENYIGLTGNYMAHLRSRIVVSKVKKSSRAKVKEVVS